MTIKTYKTRQNAMAAAQEMVDLRAGIDDALTFMITAEADSRFAILFFVGRGWLAKGQHFSAVMLWVVNAGHRVMEGHVASEWHTPS